MTDDLERRLQRLEDRAALDDLVVRYFLAADGDDLAGVGDSFTEDATFSSSGVINGDGRDGIVAFIAAARKAMGLTVHTPNYALYDFDGDDAATGVVGAHLQMVFGDDTLFGAVRYEDRYARTADGWRIRSRDMRTIHMAPWADVGAAMASDTPVRWTGGVPQRSDYPRK